MTKYLLIEPLTWFLRCIMIVLFKKRTKNISPAGLLFVETTAMSLYKLMYILVIREAEQRFLLLFVEKEERPTILNLYLKLGTRYIYDRISLIRTVR
jgi:hypothetical protein